MAFSTLVFPFVFLPVSLILYFVLPKRLKNAALVVCSLVFFAWGTPEYLVLMVLDIAFHYFAGRELALQKARGRSGRFVLVSSVLVNLLLLGFFKYYGFLVDNLNALLGTAQTGRSYSGAFITAYCSSSKSSCCAVCWSTCPAFCAMC